MGWTVAAGAPILTKHVDTMESRIEDTINNYFRHSSMRTVMQKMFKTTGIHSFLQLNVVKPFKYATSAIQLINEEPEIEFDYQFYPNKPLVLLLGWVDHEGIVS